MWFFKFSSFLKALPYVTLRKANRRDMFMSPAHCLSCWAWTLILKDLKCDFYVRGCNRGSTQILSNWESRGYIEWKRERGGYFFWTCAWNLAILVNALSEAAVHHKIFMDSIQDANGCVLVPSNIRFLAHTQEPLHCPIKTKNITSCFSLQVEINSCSK